MIGKKPPAKGPGRRKGGRPQTTGSQAAERARRQAEEARARDAQASIRDHMVEIGRGEQQAGRIGESRTS